MGGRARRTGDARSRIASSRPHRQPRTLDARADAAIVALSAARARRRGRSAPRSACPRSTVTRVLAARGPESREPARSRRRSFSATSGRTRATSCIWTSSRSAGFAASAIASTATCRGRSGASATSMSTSRSTMRRASPTSKSAGRNGAAPVPRFSATRSPGFAAAASPSVACSPTTAAGYQVAPLCRRLSHLAAAPSLHPALHAAHQRQGRALHPNAAPRVGLSPRVRQLRGSEPPRWRRICVSTTTGVPMRASVVARRGRVSKRLPNEQPL